MIIWFFDTKNKITDETADHWNEFRAIMAKLDQLEDNMSKPKDLLLDEFFSNFCTLKAWDEIHPITTEHKSVLNQKHTILLSKRKEW